MADTDLTLVVRRTIRASAARLFEAWTTPVQLLRWWGPRDVTCTAAEVDLRVGGSYRIGNRLPDGSVVIIAGRFERIDPPHELVYTWSLGAAETATERVTVRFEPRAGATEVTIRHEHIQAPPARDTHEAGWHGCLDGLEELLAPPV